MADLASERCTVCRADSPALTAGEIERLRRAVPGWAVVEPDGVPRLARVYPFPDFVRGLAFVQRVGAAAEAEGHHPRLTLEWGRVSVEWWTHAIGGLHRNDFVMAARTDALAA
jgi:4a-hydroxytetrahydrobiopterin dehydratase